MSDPLTAQCVYCGSRYVLDDAWFCHEMDCYRAPGRARACAAAVMGAKAGRMSERSFRERLLVLASNSWLDRYEKDKARRCAWHHTEGECERVYADLHRTVRQRIADWERAA